MNNQDNTGIHLDEYELKTYEYKFSHDCTEKADKTAMPRYRICPDGIYRNVYGRTGDEAHVMLTGDIMCQARQQRAALEKYGAYYFDDEFHYVKEILSKSDLAAGNLETTLSEAASYMIEEQSIGGKPHLNAPPVFLSALRNAGFDLLANANNHCCDSGLRGILDTIRHMNQYGFIHTGTFSDPSDRHFVIVEVNGIKLGFLSYAIYFNHKEENLTKEGIKTFLNKFSAETVKRDVAEAKSCGAEYIIAFIHWGQEFKTVKKQRQLDIAAEMADSGVDFIAGSHPHVLQQYETILSDGHAPVPVIYSLGNFVSHMTKPDECRDSVIVNLKFTRNNSGRVILSDLSFIPCRCMIKYNGCHYTPVPISQKRRSNGKLAPDFDRSYCRQQQILGEGIKISPEFM